MHLPRRPFLSTLVLIIALLESASIPLSPWGASSTAWAQTSSTPDARTADLLLRLGVQQYSSNQTQQALETLQLELELRRQMGDRIGEWNSLGWLGQIYERLNQPQQAREHYEAALAIAVSTGHRWGEGSMLNRIGSIQVNLGQYSEALASFEQALTIVQEIGERAGEAELCNNIGFVYQSIGQYPAALAYFEQSMAIRKEMDDRRGTGHSLNNIGFVYQSIGQYPAALAYFEQSMAIRQEIGDRQGEGQSLNNIGAIYNRLGQYDAALGYYEQSLTMALNTGDRRGEGVMQNNIGGIYSILGEYETALDYYQKSLAIYQEIGDRQGEGEAFNNIGAIYDRSGQYGVALDYYEQSLAIRQGIGDRQGEGEVFNNIGSVHHRLEQYGMALDYYEQSLAIFQETGDRAGEATTLSNLGTNFWGSGNAVQAESYLFRSIEILEDLRARDLEEEQRISLTETQLDTYQLLQIVLVAQDKITTSLEIAERSRARVFLEELNLRLNRTVETPPLQELIPDITQIRQISREQDATLVEYSIFRGQELYIWVVQPTGDVSFHSVNLQEQSLDISSLVDSARTSMGISRLVSWGDDEPHTEVETVSLNARLQELHQLLIDPIADLLPSDPDQSVIFIPQDELFLVPFAALQDADGSYLIDRHTILTAPSIQVLANTHAQQQQVEQANLQDSLVVGDPTMPLLYLVPGEEPLYLDALPGAEQEAQDIADILGTESLLGSTAKKSIVVEQMPRSRIIHLATHGLLDESQGLNGGVVLAADGTGEFNDGLLTAAEIAQMDLNAEMVVLSACNTGQGRITGDGVIGLSRSLILAGVPSVVVSLWAVPDAPTGELMVEFYRQLEVADNKAQALRQAMLTMREEYPNPIAWAAFTLIGEAGSVNTSSIQAEL